MRPLLVSILALAITMPALAQMPQSTDLSTREFQAIQATIPQLDKLNLKVTDYKRISVSGDNDSIVVEFSQRYPEAHWRGNSAQPGEAPDIEIHLSTKDLSVIRWNFER